LILVDTSVMIDWIKNIDTAQTQILDNAITYYIPYGISAYTYMETLQAVTPRSSIDVLIAITAIEHNLFCCTMIRILT